MINKIKNKLKSNKGFTIQDVLIACFIITVFVGLITTMLYSVYRENIKATLMSKMTVYAVQILENIDKISYEEVQNKTISEYREEFSIPEGFNIQIEISNYGENSASRDDVIKIIKLTISYTMGDVPEEISIKRLKIKEI